MKSWIRLTAAASVLLGVFSVPVMAQEETGGWTRVHRVSHVVDRLEGRPTFVNGTATAPLSAPEGNAMYRLYNPNSGEHFYTQDRNERDYLVQVGWTLEGLGWYAPNVSGTPVYRLYNPNAGDHFYTAAAREKDHLVSMGWIDEGTGWYSADALNGTPLYRSYNPNAQTGSHNYTQDAREYEFLAGQGWKSEDIGWYGISTVIPTQGYAKALEQSMTEYQAALSDAAKKRSLDGLYEKADTLAALSGCDVGWTDSGVPERQACRLVRSGTEPDRTERLGSESSDSDLLALEAAADARGHGERRYAVRKRMLLECQSGYRPVRNGLRYAAKRTL